MNHWQDLNYDWEEFTMKVAINNIPNAMRVVNESDAADFNLIWEQR